MNPSPQIQELIVSINQLTATMQAYPRGTVVLVVPSAASGFWNVSITADLITAIGAIVITSIICWTVLFALGMCQAHYRMKEVLTNHNEEGIDK